jgi:predicted secreted Zn-dependent protease
VSRSPVRVTLVADTAEFEVGMRRAIRATARLVAWMDDYDGRRTLAVLSRRRPQRLCIDGHAYARKRRARRRRGV